MRLLFAYDGSRCSDGALDELPRLGLPADTEATVLSVADIWMPAAATPADAIDIALSPGLAALRVKTMDLLAAAQAQAEEGAGKLRKACPTWQVTAKAEADSPGWGIVKAAEELKVDLLMVGSHGRGALGRVLLGSVSQRVLTSAPCSVHVARPRSARPEGPFRLMLAVDGSADSIAAMRALTSRAWPRDTVVRVTAVVDARLESVMAWPGIFPSEWASDRTANPREWVCHMVEHFARRLYDAKLNVDTDILEGEPKHELLRHAEGWGADLIVMGAHGLQHGQARTLGSVAAAVAARAHCSVEIIRGTGEAAG